MGTWGVAPFANDSADELLDALRDAEPDARAVAVGALLSGAISEGQDADPAEVVAAGAIVAAGLPGSPPVPGAGGLVDGWLTPDAAVALRAHAVQAIDICLTEGAWYWDSWTSERDREQAREGVAALRALLRGAGA